MLNRRQALLGSSMLVGFHAWPVALYPMQVEPLRTFTPEQFGAKGDGVANDTGAFQRLSAAVVAHGEGRIVLRPVTYIVGAQRIATGGTYAWDPAPILELEALRGPIVIDGQGATLQCARGLRYGTFDPATGQPTRHNQPFYKHGETASPYRWMIRIARCTGTIEISSITLDGNLAALRIGGPWGDIGHQLPAAGIGLYDNSGAELLTDVICRNHALDGITIDGVAARRAADSIFTRVTCRGNGRQGCSIVGGNRYRFVHSAFEDTGTGVLASPPRAGVDLEAEGDKTVRAIRFEQCRFAGNAGVGLLASEGDVADVTVIGCTFVATRNWGTWPAKPNIRFHRCRFVGAIANTFGSDNPALATRFTRCSFVDDPAAAGGRRVYGGENPDRPIAVLPYGLNTHFAFCTFRLTADCVLPWSKGVIYESCVMTQASPKRSYPRGTFVGKNTVTGNADINYSRIRGPLTINGRQVGQDDILH